MATLHRNEFSITAEVFQAHLHSWDRLSDPVIQVVEHRTAAAALASAFNWSRRGGFFKAEVWVNDWQIFDSATFDLLTLRHRCAPVAPGRYRVEVTPSDEVIYHLSR